MIRPRRLAALAMLATSTLATLGAPVSAAPDGTVKANVLVRDLTLPAGGPTVDDHLSVYLTSDHAGWANEVTLTVDTSAVTAVADIAVEAADFGVTCSTTGPVVRCTTGPHRIIEVPESGSFGFMTSGSVRLSLTAKTGAVAGDAGTVTVTAKADDGPTTTETTRVRIGEGVNLTAVDAPPQSVTPGGSVALRPRVRNTGTRDVQGLTLVANGDEALADTNFGNCTCGGGLIACSFDSTLAAERTYEISKPFTVRIPRDAAAGSETGMFVQWLTNAEWEDWQDNFDGLLDDLRPGTGSNLELAEVAASAAADVPQADINGDDNGSATTVTVTGGRRADIVAVGAKLPGTPSEVHTIEVGLINRGPGALRYPPFVNNLPWTAVTLPPGLNVLKADERCSAPFAEDPAGPPPSVAPDSGARQYLCLPESVRVGAGQRLTYRFTVQVIRSGRGSVEVLMPVPEGTAADNSAPITVGSPGGGLPITGSTPATVAAGGALLLLTGAAVMLTLRRRRLRRG